MIVSDSFTDVSADLPALGEPTAADRAAARAALDAAGVSAAATVAALHTHGHCKACGAWLEGRKYCHKCGAGYAGPLLEAGTEAPPPDPPADPDSIDPEPTQAAGDQNPNYPSTSMPVNGDVGLVATGGVDQEDPSPMTTTVPRPGTTPQLDQHNRAAARAAATPGDFADAGIGMVAWRGVIAVEGRATGDGRMFRPGALYWDEGYLPADLFAMLADPDGGVGHDGSTICGRIDRMWKADNAAGYVEVWGEGFYDTSTPTGAEVLRLQRQGMLTGVSVDVDSVEVVMPDMGADGIDLLDILFGGGIEEYSSGRIRRATICSIPAFIEAHVSPVDDAGALIASAAATLAYAHISPLDDAGRPLASAAAVGCAGLRAWTPVDVVQGSGGATTLVASAAGFRARPKAKDGDLFHGALVDADPPGEVFARRDYATFTPFEVDADGRVSGHATPWGECHIGFSDRCVTAPRSRCGYAHARTGHVLTAEGDLVPTARVFAQFGYGARGHADETLDHRPAVEWYENQTLALADVAIFEDNHGIQIQGRVRPGVTRAQVVALRASRISPDWRDINGALECVGLALVNVSGFTGGSQHALVASALAEGLTVAGLGADLTGSAYLVAGEVRTLIASGGPGRDATAALVAVVAAQGARLEALEQAELARQATQLLSGLPSEAEEQERLAARAAAALDGVDLDVAAAAEPERAVVEVGVEELETLRAALAITERLARDRDTEEAAEGDTMECPFCGEMVDAAAAGGACPECGMKLPAQAAGATVVASAGCQCAEGSCECGAGCQCGPTCACQAASA